LYYFGINLPFIAGAVLSIGSIWFVYRFMELDRAASVQ
jgi:hypothetical protein